MDNTGKSIATQAAFKMATDIVCQDRTDQSDDMAVQRIALMGDTLADVLIEKITSLEVGSAFPGATPIAAAPSYNPEPNFPPVPANVPPQGQPFPPQQQYSQPAPIPGVVQGDNSAAWLDVCQNPGGWWDNRLNKKNPKGPDFQAKKDNHQFQQPNGYGVGLWVNDKAIPASVRTHLGIR
jgi:hypothetical protein